MHSSPSRQRPVRSRTSVRAFSLVELIVVIGLIVVLAGIGVYAFTNQGSGMAITTAASQVSTAVAGARQLAVSSNARTRFIILADSDQNEEEWKLRTYGILKEEVGVKVGNEPLFTMVSQLEQLPAGVYFAPFDEQLDITVNDGQMFEESRLGTQPIQGRQDAQYAYIEFLPTGGTTTSTGRNVFMMLRAAGPGEPLPNAENNKVGIGVAQMTGRVKVERFTN
ncbi:MAG: pilus assembly FimT family protein [Chthoniobacteraceae bacterium]